MKRKQILAAAAAAVLASACETTGSVLPSVFTETGNEGPLIEISGQTEYATDADGVMLLDAVENRGALYQLVLNMPQTEAELNGMLARVSQHWPHDIPVEPTTKMTMIAQYSGAAYADGTITLGLGTLAPIMQEVVGDEYSTSANIVGSDEELMFLIAHEFAHYALGHHNKNDFMASIISGSAKLTKLHNQAAVLRELRYVDNGGTGQIVVKNQSGVNEDWSNAIGKFDLVNALASQALNPAWNRSQEDEADVLALDLMRAEGITGGSYEAMFANLKAHENLTNQFQSALEGSLKDVQTQLLAPDNLTRMLDGQVEQTGSSIFDSARRGLMRQGQNILVGYLGQSHRPPAVRLEGVRKYERNAYGITAEAQEEALFFSEPSTEVIDRIRSLKEFQDARKITLAYYKSIDARSNGDFATAEAEITSAMAIPSFGQQSAILYEAGRVAESLGNPTLAMQRYQAATEQTPLPDAFRRLIYVQVRTGLYSDAEQTIATGKEKLNDESYFWPSEIRLAAARENHDEAIRILSTCREDSNTDLLAACEAARAGVDFDTLTAEQKAAYTKNAQVGEDGIGGFLGGVNDLLGGNSN